MKNIIINNFANWLEILCDAEIVPKEKLVLLLNEYEEILKIVNTVRHNMKKG